MSCDDILSRAAKREIIRFLDDFPLLYLTKEWYFLQKLSNRVSDEHVNLVPDLLYQLLKRHNLSQLLAAHRLRQVLNPLKTKGRWVVCSVCLPWLSNALQPPQTLRMLHIIEA